MEVETSSAESPMAVGVDFDRLGDDRFSRHLLAEVDHIVAVVGKDGLDQVLADIVHVTVDGSEYYETLADAFLLFKIVLEVCHGFLHDLGRLQHERQDELARAELVADLLHGGEQYGVKHVNGCFVFRGEFAAIHERVDIGFHAFLVPMQDGPMQTLFRRHVGGRVGGFPSIAA